MGLVWTGQSLGTGYASVPPLTTTQPFKNKMFGGGLFCGYPSSGFVPLIEALHPDAIVNGGQDGETGAASACNLASSLENSLNFVVSNCGRSSRSFAQLFRTNECRSLEEGLAQMQAGQILSNMAGGVHYSPLAWVLVHGQGDEAIGNAQYYADLIWLQQRVSTQVGTVVKLLQTQMCSWAYNAAGTGTPYPRSGVPFAQLQAALDNPHIFLACPQYFLPHLPDGIHLTNIAQQWQGEFIGKVLYRLATGNDWKPLYPKDATWNPGDRTITVRFNVPAPPLQWDVKNATDPNNGFVVKDAAGNTLPITTTTLGTDAVIITIGGTAIPNKCSYGCYAAVGTNGDRLITGRHLVDSDATASRHGHDLRNRCVVRDLVVAMPQASVQPVS